MKYRAEIDGLRALAVLPVVFFHGGVEIFKGGYIGVDIFFVISGYLITTIIINDIDAGKFSLAHFYERRVRRLLPALFLVLIASIPFAFILLPGAYLENFFLSVMSVIVFSSNILFWYEVGYFDAGAEIKPLLHTWSLAVEEQYYIIFPLLLLLAFKIGRKTAITVTAVIFVLSLGYSLDNANFDFFLPHTRIWEILLGSLCAFYLQNRHVDYRRSTREFFTTLGLAAIVFAIFTFESPLPAPAWFRLVPTVGTLLLIIFADNQSIAGKLLRNPVVVGIGLISYSLYLWHYPMFAFARFYHGKIALDGMTVSLLILAAFCLAYLTWRFVEKPFRNRQFLSRKIIFGLASIVALGIFLVAAPQYFIKSHAGVQRELTAHDGRVIKGDMGHEDFYGFLNDSYFPCHSQNILDESFKWKSLFRKGFTRCFQSGEGVPDVVLLGDSHAEHLFPGLAEAVPDKNVAIYLRHQFQILQISDGKAAYIFDELASNGKKQTVILNFYYLRDNSVGLLDTEQLHEKLAGLIKFLIAADKQVILLSDIPYHKYTAGICVFGSLVGKDNMDCETGLSEADEQYKLYEPMLKSLVSEFDIPYIDIHKFPCSENNCNMIQDDTLLYRDDSHLNIQGSIKVGRRLADALKDLPRW